jgi:hypothetical protein
MPTSTRGLDNNMKIMDEWDEIMEYKRDLLEEDQLKGKQTIFESRKRFKEILDEQVKSK